MLKKRITYFDVAKGLLISIVVLHHYLLYAHSIYGIQNKTIGFLFDYQKVLLCFFMPGFFFITGCCSNFNKKFNVFLWGNFKTLIVPSVFFTLLTRLLAGEYNHLHSEIIRSTIVDIVLFGGHYWFLQALFIAKIIYWVINKQFSSKFAIFFFCLIIALGGNYLNQYDIIPNFWFHRHAMDLCLYIALGCILKNHLGNSFFRTSTVIYIFTIVLLLVFNGHIPYLTRSFSYSLPLYPLHTVLSVTGSILILYLSKIINSNSILEYLGKASLVIYVCHIPFSIQPILKLSKSLLGDSGVVSSIIIILLEILITLAICALFYRLINTKYLKWIIGK